MGKNKIVIWLWSFVWQHWLGPQDKVVKVKGWRTAVIDKYSYTRQTITPCFWWFQ